MFNTSFKNNFKNFVYLSGKKCCKIFWCKYKFPIEEEFYSVVIEFFEKTGFSNIKFIWSSYSQTSEVVPKERLYRSSFIEESPIRLKVLLGSTHEINKPFMEGQNYAISYGIPFNKNAYSSIVNTIFIQSKDIFSNNADHNNDIYILELILNHNKTNELFGKNYIENGRSFGYYLNGTEYYNKYIIKNNSQNIEYNLNKYQIIKEIINHSNEAAILC